jgi:hypothetical protein
VAGVQRVHRPLGIVNKQLEIMGRYMVELGMTPAARSRVMADSVVPPQEVMTIRRVIVSPHPVRELSDTEPEQTAMRALDERAWLAKYGGSGDGD